jgi:hypothetical protein
MVIRHVAPLSAAKVFATIYAVIGLVVGAILTFAASMGGVAAQALGVIAPVVGVAAIIILPIVYACIGFIGTLLVASIYNVAAGMVGGIEIDVDQGANVT